MEFRKRQKAEDAKAREKIRLKLEEDRKERRRKLGLPEEETEEEKAARLERERARAEAEKAKQKNVNRPMTVPVTVQTKLRECLVAMKKQYGDDPGLTVCFQTLMKLVGNVAKVRTCGRRAGRSRGLTKKPAGPDAGEVSPDPGV